ncbi:MAG TPA: TM2 domain-containing protein [Clostridiales bacterium]|nr:TM2 domain-containing protein [Clostridiales bacterium]
MFCRHCGSQMDNCAAVCVKCGTAAGNGVSFCPNCGAETPMGSVVCTHCGYALPQMIDPSTQKSKMAAGLLGIFLGAFGVHNFYLGYTGKAVAQLLISVVSCGILAIVSEIWGLVEGIQILTGSINTDSNGVPLKD